MQMECEFSSGNFRVSPTAHCPLTQDVAAATTTVKQIFMVKKKVMALLSFVQVRQTS